LRTETDVNTANIPDQKTEVSLIKRFRSWVSVVGPGMITAALVFGPSKVTISSKLGAEYGYALLWIIVVAIFFMTVFTAMASRIGIATDQSFLTIVKNKWGKGFSVAIGVGIFLVCTSFQAGNSIGLGISIAELFNTSAVPWILVFNMISIALLFAKSFYKILERIMILLILLMLAAFLCTFFLSLPSAKMLMTGFVPSIPAQSLPLVIAFMASCFSVVGALYQSYLVQEKRRISPGIKQKSTDSYTGIFILGLMSAIVLICAATVLYPKGISINSGADMAKVLEPIFGNYAAAFFLTGLFGAAFSSLIGNASLGGILLADALGHGSNLGGTIAKVLVAVVMIIGATLSIVFGKLPISLMIFAQSITILVVPFIGISMFLIANDAKIMGDLRNSLKINVAALLGLLILIILALKNIQTLFF
jgi:manganese transport protein